MKHVQTRDIIFFAVVFLIFLPIYVYPRWKKRQLAPPAVQSAPTSPLKDILFSLGVWLLFIIPAVLAIYAFTANGLARQLGLLAIGMLAPLVFLFFRFKLWRRG